MVQSTSRYGRRPCFQLDTLGITDERKTSSLAELNVILSAGIFSLESSLVRHTKLRSRVLATWSPALLGWSLSHYGR